MKIWRRSVWQIVITEITGLTGIVKKAEYTALKPAVSSRAGLK